MQTERATRLPFSTTAIAVAVVLLGGVTAIVACSDIVSPGADTEEIAIRPEATNDGADERRSGDQDVFVVVEQMPTLIDGIAGIHSRLRYPDIAKLAGVEGRVTVQFVVNERGEVENPIVMRGIGAGCDEAALAAVRDAKFTPGMQRGEPVKVRMTLPVTFKL